MRKRANYFANRYNQWVIAGKIAVQTKAINPYLDNGQIAAVYRLGVNKWATLHYSVIGQEYLRQLNLKVTEL